MSEKELPQGPLGYAIDEENRDALEDGDDPGELMSAFSAVKPDLNVQAMPTGVVTILNQGNQGACQGHALATVFQICYFLSTGRLERFSRAAAYYLSQRFDGIRGDRGSTLSGGRKVATEHGLCLEKYWPYPSRYNSREPSSAAGNYEFKLKVSRPFRNVDEAMGWLKLGLPIQTGIRWGSSMNREVVTSPSRSGGGHSTTLWTLEGDDPRNINSWGKNWNGDGVHVWRRDVFAQMLADRYSTFVGYAPEGMAYPTPEPIA